MSLHALRSDVILDVTSFKSHSFVYFQQANTYSEFLCKSKELHEIFYEKIRMGRKKSKKSDEDTSKEVHMKETNKKEMKNKNKTQKKI